MEGITACCLSRDRGYLAACERITGIQHSHVSVYDCAGPVPRLKKRLEPASGRLTVAAFSPEGPARFLAFISAGAESAVVIMEWQNDRVIGRVVVGSPLDRLAFAPHDSNQLSVSGPHTLKLPRLRDSKVKEGAKALPSFNGIDESAITITDHAWAEPGDGTLIACDQEGHVYLLSSQEMRIIGEPIDAPFQDADGQSTGVPCCIRCFSQGFILGGSEGLVAVWERVDNAPSPPGQKQVTSKEFRHVRTVRVRQTESSVVSLDMTATEESLILGFRNSDIGHMSMASLYISRPGDADCSVFSGGFHNGPITGLDMAAQRPLIASTCRKDSSMRIWNYASRQCDLRAEFAGDPPSGVAIHPFGYFVAVSFADKLRIFQVLVSELKLHREFAITRIRMLRFSNGGHLLVAAQGKSVHVFTVRTFAKITQLTGHTQPVRALCFEPDDHFLRTGGEDGTICEWSTLTWEQVRGYSSRPKHLQYCALSWSPAATGDTYCGAVDGPHYYMQRFRQEVSELTLEHELEIPGHVRVQALCHANGGPEVQNLNAMFACTSSGALWIYHNPVENPDEYREVGLHLGSCNFVCLSSDGRTLATAGDDGAIFVLAVTGLIAGDEDRGEAEGRVAEAEVVLINRNEIQQQQDEFQLLQAENVMLKGRLEEEKAKLETECETRVFEARQRDQAEIQELSRRCDTLRQATTVKEQESLRVRGQMEETHNEAHMQLENLYEKKLEFESERLVELKAEQIRLEGVIKDIRKQTDIQLEEERNNAQEELERQLAEKELEIQKHKDLIAFSQHRLEKVLSQEGRQHDQEVAEMKVHAHQELEERKCVEADLRREQDTLWMGLHQMQKDRDAVEREQHEGDIQIANLKAQSEELTRTLKSLVTEKRERETTLDDKNSKIESYKSKVKELKKFRHMLNRDLKEVTESLQPKDHMIKQLQNHLHEFEMEFEKQLKDQRAKEDHISTKQQQITCLTTECKKLKSGIQEKDRTIARYTSDLHNLVTNPDVEKKDWPAEIRRIYHVHVCKQSFQEDRLPVEEIQRQMRQMEGQLTTLAVKGAQMESTCKKDIQRKAQENATLVHELNQLRVQNKSLQNKVKILEGQLKELGPGQLSIENEARPSSAPAPPPPAAKPAMPKVPSAGSLPGPRQRAQSPFEEETFAAQPLPRKGMAGRSLHGRKSLKMSAEEKNQMQNLKLTADVNAQHLQVQQEESKQLRQQVAELLQPKDTIKRKGTKRTLKEDSVDSVGKTSDALSSDR